MGRLLSVNNDSTCLILTEKTSSPAANHHSGQLVTVSFHVDTGTITGVALDIDFAAPHCIACGISNAAVDNDPACVHSISNGVLRISVNFNAGSVQICTQRISRGSRYRKVAVFQSCADESLSEEQL